MSSVELRNIPALASADVSDEKPSWSESEKYEEAQFYAPPVILRVPHGESNQGAANAKLWELAAAVESQLRTRKRSRSEPPVWVRAPAPTKVAIRG